MLQGSITALITPFNQGEVDSHALAQLVHWQIEQGCHGLVACGSTGEGMTLSSTEWRRVVDVCVQTAAKRVRVIAGTGKMTPSDTIDATLQAKELGVDAALIIVPPYLKPSEAGIVQHFKAINDAVKLPLLVYNHPGRTGTNLSLETIVRLAELEYVVGLKDASGDICRPLELRTRIKKEFAFFSGDDVLTLPILAQGGQGGISITANVAPKLCAQLYEAWVAGDLAKVATIRDQLYPLHMALNIEGNPTPVKYAAAVLGLCQEEVRAPLAPITQASREIVQNALYHAGLTTTTTTTTTKAIAS